MATGVLTLTLYKVLDNSVLSTTKLNVSVVNPNVIMTMETNPEVLTILYNKCSHRMSSSEYLLRTEAELFTDSDIYIDATNSIFTGKSITHFEEFEYFTGLTTIPAFCFSACSSLTKLALPENVESIGLNAFQNTILTNLHVPRKVKTIDQGAFSFAKQLTGITVDNYNSMFTSDGHSLYKGIGFDVLYVVAPGLTEYTMPVETTSVYGDGDVTWRSASLLKKIILNDKVQGVTGKWFMYGFSNLTEITGPERSDIKYHNGCIYNSDYSKLIYWPSGKAYSEEGLKHNDSGECLVNEFGERSFSQNKLLGSFTIPSTVTKLGEWVFYSTSIPSIKVHSNVTSIGNYCFSWNTKLKTAEIDTIRVNGTNLFTSCSNLETVSLASVDLIPDSMFSTCSNLVTIDIPETVTSIGAFAFNNCSKLISITIPSGVKNIGQSCFMGCTKLGDINSLASIAPSLGTEAFGNDPSNYTGNKVDVKELHVPRTATGYESND